MKRVLLILSIPLVLSTCKKNDDSTSRETLSKIVEYTYPKNNGPNKNPMKGRKYNQSSESYGTLIYKCKFDLSQRLRSSRIN